MTNDLKNIIYSFYDIDPSVQDALTLDHGGVDYLSILLGITHHPRDPLHVYSSDSLGRPMYDHTLSSQIRCFFILIFWV